MKKRSLLVATFVIALVSAATLVFALPGPTACVLIGAADLHELPGGTLTESATPDDQQRYIQLTRDAHERIKTTFGAAQSKPIIVFFNRLNWFGPLRFNAHGSTQFIGSRACIMVGPKGQSVDVVAHELMHAELHHRLGSMKRLMQLPAWFDEGIAMQVDYRNDYVLSPQDALSADYVRDFATFSSFFKGDRPTVIRNYGSAKQVVGSWLAKVGNTSLYGHLQRMKNGESFADVVVLWKLSRISTP